MTESSPLLLLSPIFLSKSPRQKNEGQKDLHSWRRLLHLNGKIREHDVRIDNA